MSEHDESARFLDRLMRGESVRVPCSDRASARALYLAGRSLEATVDWGHPGVAAWPILVLRLKRPWWQRLWRR